jgi:hypothetical protein
MRLFYGGMRSGVGMSEPIEKAPLLTQKTREKWGTRDHWWITQSPALYSQRRAVWGLILAARRAGIQQAKRATAARKRGSMVKVTRSWGRMP